MPAGPTRRSSPETTLAESATAGCRLADLPGVARGQKLRDAPRPAVGDGALLLLEYDLLVDRRLDCLQHADRHREVRREQVGEDLGGVDVLFVVNPERALGHVGQV